jgi:uncharacterized membrane protein YeaQ/YmgE (transglycosylase-associated protein family)
VYIVVAGLLVIAGLGAYAMYKSEGDMAPLAAAAFGVIGSVVGAFFGVHAGAGMARRESERAHLESKATQRMLVAMMDDEQRKKEVKEILDRSEPSAG